MAMSAVSARRRRLLVGALLGAMIWLALAALAPASGLACSNVEFIGVRGSGESYSGNFGMGTQIADLFERVRARKPGNQTLQSYGLEYPADQRRRMVEGVRLLPERVGRRRTSGKPHQRRCLVVPGA